MNWTTHEYADDIYTIEYRPQGGRMYQLQVTPLCGRNYVGHLVTWMDEELASNNTKTAHISLEWTDAQWLAGAMQIGATDAKHICDALNALSPYRLEVALCDHEGYAVGNMLDSLEEEYRAEFDPSQRRGILAEWQSEVLRVLYEDCDIHPTSISYERRDSRYWRQVKDLAVIKATGAYVNHKRENVYASSDAEVVLEKLGEAMHYLEESLRLRLEEEQMIVAADAIGEFLQHFGGATHE